MSRLGRLYGLGSVFGKALRDSRRAALAVLALLATLLIAGGWAMADTYGTPETRAALATMATGMPDALRGLYGNPLNVDTLGGFLSWHYGSDIALLVGLWSILALSGTLASEASRGSLDMLAATGRSRRSIALQKALGHVAAMMAVMAVLAVIAWGTGAAFGKYPGDAISPERAVAFVAGVAVRGLIAGSVGFALAPLLGRGAAAGIAGAVLLGGYLVYGYRAVVPLFDTIASWTWFSWLAGHIPLAGAFDWGGVALSAAATTVLLAVGLELFARRDIGVTMPLPSPRLPSGLVGIRGPVARAFGEVLPVAAWWGIGCAIYGAAMTFASKALLDMLNDSPALTAMYRSIVPGLDLTTSAGFLQLAFVDFGFILIGLAVAQLLAGRWSDETSGRLEVLLSTPLARVRWALTGGVALVLGVGVVNALLAAAVGTGIAALGQNAWTAVTGTLVLGAYGIAMAGLGMAAGGLLGPGAPAPVVAVFALGTFLLDTLAPVLRLPAWVSDVALTTHLGEPLVGRWDTMGLAICAAMAVGGMALGAWGLQRRDVAR